MAGATERMQDANWASVQNWPARQRVYQKAWRTVDRGRTARNAIDTRRDPRNRRFGSAVPAAPTFVPVLSTGPAEG
ncbi:MAG: hypothetical protein OXL68_00490 [Paracoccaceae bacterium]|nr:hypothetical protein [Paracoccaceae bacterium]